MLYNVAEMKQIQQGQSTRNEMVFQVVMPLDVGIMIPEDATVRLLKEITERMDFSKLNQSYARKVYAGGATPKQLFEIVILGFMKGRCSLRDFEDACQYDICFRFLLGNQGIPDHSRFGRFIRERLQEETAEHLFYQLIRDLREREEIEGKSLFVDGTKIEANANRYSFVWAKSVGKNAEKLEEKTARLLKEINLAYPLAMSGAQAAEEVLLHLEAMAQEQGIEFVHGKGNRKKQIQKHIESLRMQLSKAEEYRNHRAIMGQRNSYSKTDHDATFMRMKEDHMQNGQLKPAYNVQIGVEGEYIVGVDITSDRNDAGSLLPLLARMNEQGGLVHEQIVADAGYESEENYTQLEQRGQEAYIKPQNYEKSKQRSFRQNAFLRENMPYDAQEDCYTCPAGKKLRHEYDKVRRSKTDYEQNVSIYLSEGCAGCSVKAMCTKAKENRRIEVSKTFLRQRSEALERITSEKGILLRINRSIQAEGAIGVLKEDWGFRRFLRRGNPNVMTELLLRAFAYDVNKLHNKRSQQRLKTQLIVPKKTEYLPNTG